MLFKSLFSKDSGYEKLRTENRRLISIFSEKDTDGKLTDMINDVYSNWEPFHGRDMYKHLLSELNELMEAFISNDKAKASEV